MEWERNKICGGMRDFSDIVMQWMAALLLMAAFSCLESASVLKSLENFS